MGMNAGPELDALIASKVMGWTTQKAKSDGMEFDQWLEPASVGFVVQYRPPNYSTDIAAAWEVVEKLQARFLRVDVSAINSDGFTVKIWVSEYADHIYAMGDTAPLAICLAALKSVGA